LPSFFCKILVFYRSKPLNRIKNTDKLACESAKRKLLHLRFISDRVIVILALIAIVAIGSFLLALIVPELFFHSTVPQAWLFDVRLVLFFAAMVSLFGLGPFIVYEFRQKVKLQDAINHYVKNKMQEIVLVMDLVESNLVKTDAPGMTNKEKVEMLEDVRAICQDVSGNLATKILAEAPKFKHSIAAADTPPINKSPESKT
jgi:hypothetical protein